MRLYHPYTLGVMPNHPTGYTGIALYQDRGVWSMLVQKTRPDGRQELHNVKRSRYRVVVLVNALLGRVGQVGTGA